MSSAVTTYRGAPKVKPFSWSYSKLKNYESCPKRYWHVDVQKDVKEEESGALLHGNQVHSALANRIEKGTPLPTGLDEYEPICARIVAGNGKTYVEQKLAITADFGPCDFFDKQKHVWFRGVGDVIKIHGPVALILDWKTGKIVEDSVQLALMAACVFAHYPEVQKVRSTFFWLAHDAETTCHFERKDMPAFWASLWPRLSSLEQAHKLTEFPAKPGFLCKRWCPVKTCPHHGT